MDERTREQQAADILKTMKLFMQQFLTNDIAERIQDAGTNQAKQRQIASDTATFQLLTNGRDWEVNMTTNPGDIVYDPDHNYRYIFTGTETYKHTNPLFYPGAAGVYHWAIIPRIKDFIPIYPAVEGIIVSVKNGSIWWNTEETQKYKWVGVDNDNCVWPPSDSVNEWQKIED